MGDIGSQTELKLRQCNRCGKRYVPPKYLCTACDQTDFSDISAQGSGEVYSFTIIRMTFEEFAAEAPYAFGEMKLAEGLVVPGRFTNEKEKPLAIGTKVSFVEWRAGANWFQLT